MNDETEWFTTVVVVTGIVFSILGVALGYIVGYIDAEFHYKIRSRK